MYKKLALLVASLVCVADGGACKIQENAEGIALFVSTKSGTDDFGKSTCGCATITS
ncbi:MAG: hypothetical protein PUE55_02900 [Bacteroidales bacterium]|nr:hypothetical protein [Bacteroidales bacterium]